jgi:hypothetical protein
VLWIPTFLAVLTCTTEIQSETIPAWLQLSNDGLPIYQVYLLETAGQTKPLLFYFTGEVDIELRLAVFGYEFTDM